MVCQQQFSLFQTSVSDTLFCTCDSLTYRLKFITGAADIFVNLSASHFVLTLAKAKWKWVPRLGLPESFEQCDGFHSPFEAQYQTDPVFIFEILSA